MSSVTTSVNPCPVEHLYRLRDASGALLYVGISNNWPTRMKQHQANKPWWHRVANVELVAVSGSRAQLEAIEKAVIKAEEPMYNVMHNRQTSARMTVLAPVPEPVEVVSPFNIGDRVCLVGRRYDGGAPGWGTIDGTSSGGGCWLVSFDNDVLGVPWTLCSNEIELLVEEGRRFHDYGVESMTPDERQAIVEQFSHYGPEWHEYATRSLQPGWLVEHPEHGEGIVTHVQLLALDSTVTVTFYDDGMTRELCAEWVPLKVVAK